MVRLTITCEPDDGEADFGYDPQRKIDVDFEPPDKFQYVVAQRGTKSVFEYLKSLLAPNTPSGWHIVEIEWRPMLTTQHFSSMAGVRTIDYTSTSSREPLDFTQYRGPISNEQLAALVERPPKEPEDRTVRLDLDDAKEVEAPRVIGRAIDI